jgi:hypothetical protein
MPIEVVLQTAALAVVGLGMMYGVYWFSPAGRFDRARDRETRNRSRSR